MDNASLRNFKDFLQQYNKITETCFSHCINTLGDRSVSPEELRCVDLCALKHIRVNHKVMQVYLEVQPMIMNRRIEELNQAQASAITSTPDDAAIPDVPVLNAINQSDQQPIEQMNQPLTTQS